MIVKNDIEVAEKLLSMILEDERAKGIEGYVSMFDNCREQGYRLAIYYTNGEVKTVAFSENRSSDDIVVYYSNKYESGLSYSNTFWNSAKLFKQGDYEGAKEYILDIIGAKTISLDLQNIVISLLNSMEEELKNSLEYYDISMLYEKIAKMVDLRVEDVESILRNEINWH